MLFKFKGLKPKTSWRFRKLVKIYHLNGAKAAIQHFQDYQLVLSEPDEYLVLADIFEDLEHSIRARALRRLARIKYPNHENVRIESFIDKPPLRDVFDHINSLKTIAAGLSWPRNNYVITLAALRYAQLGFSYEFNSLLKNVSLQKKPADAISCYILSKGFAAIRQWKQAAIYAEKALYFSKNQWCDAARLLIEQLLAKSELGNAISRTVSTEKKFATHPMVHWQAALLHFSRGDFSTARNSLLRYQELTVCRNTSHLQSMLAVTYWLDNDHKKASTIFNSLPASYQFDINPTNSKQIYCLCGPILCQETDMCVPTSVAICCAIQGDNFDPKLLYKEMKGFNGTEIWRMKEVMENKGYSVQFVINNIETIKKNLANDLPLIATTQGYFHSHVEVICGYIGAIDCVIVRDPESLYPHLVPVSSLQDRYAASGNYLIQLSKYGDKASSDIHQDAEVYTKYCKAVATGDKTTALDFFTALKSNINLLLDVINIGFGVVVNPSEHQEITCSLASSETVHTINKVRALIQTGQIQQLAKLDITNERDKFPRVITDFFNACVLQGQKLFEESNQILEELASKYPSIYQIWTKLAEVQISLGRVNMARQSMQRAIELSNRSHYVVNQLNQLFPVEMDFHDRLKEIDKMIEESPSEASLIDEKARWLKYGANGKEYESVIRDAIDRRPLLPGNYEDYAGWLLDQGRSDLAVSILKQGRALIGEKHLPQWPFEKNMLTDKDDPAATSIKSSISTTSLTISTNKNEILDKFQDYLYQWRNGNSNIDFAQLKEIIDTLSFSKYQFELEWWQSVALEAMKIVIKIATISSGDIEKSLKDSFPDDLAGRLPHNLKYFNDCIGIQRLSSKASRILLAHETKMLKNYEWNCYLAFDLAFLAEQGGQLVEASNRYRDISKKVKNHYGIWFRLGCTYQKMGNFTGAKKAFSKAVTLNPSNQGALENLIEIFGMENDFERRAKCQKKLINIWPYFEPYIENYCLDSASRYGFDQGKAALDEYKANIRDISYRVIVSKLLVQTGKFQEALNAIENICLPNDYERQLTTIRIDALFNLEKYDDAILIVNDALKKNENDLWMKSTKLMLLEKIDQESYPKYLHELIYKECLFDDFFVFRFMETFFANDPDSVFKMIDLFTESQAIAFGESMLRYFYSVKDHPNRIRLGKYFNEHHKNAFYIRENYAYFKMMKGSDRAAEKIMMDIYERDNRDPKWLLSLGRMIQDVNPVRSLRYLKEEYALTGRIDTLAYIARSYHLIGDVFKAKQGYFKVLEIDPGYDIAINNLLSLSISPSSLFTNVVHCLERGGGASTQFFHIYAIKAARSAGKSLPKSWIIGAVRRFDSLDYEAPFPREREYLGLAISKWFATVGDLEKAEQYSKRSGVGRFNSLRLRWPGKKWIPKHQSQQPNKMAA